MSEQVNPYGKVFAGQEIVVEMAVFSERNGENLYDVLLKFTGGPAFSAGIDGKVLRYRASHGGSGQNFTIESGGSTLTRMISRSAMGRGEFFEVFLDGKTHTVALDPEKSKSCRPQELLSTYQSRFADAPPTMKVEEALKEVVAKSKAGGWPTAHVQLEWTGLADDLQARSRAIDTVRALDKALSSLLSDSLGKEALAEIHQMVLTITPGQALAVDRDGKTVFVKIGIHTETQDISGSLINLLSEKL